MFKAQVADGAQQLRLEQEIPDYGEAKVSPTRSTGQKKAAKGRT